MSLGNLKFKNRRRHLRFEPGPNSIAAVSLTTQTDSDDPTDFTADFVGLPLTESYKGCSIIIRDHEGIVVNKELMIKIGELNPLLARVAWVRSLNELASEVGIEFLE